jgi:hypothetical protein
MPAGAGLPMERAAEAIVHVDTSQDLTNSAGNLIQEDTNDNEVSNGNITKGEE